MKIAHKITIFFLAASFLCLSVTMGFVYWSAKKTLTRAIVTSLQSNVHARTRHIETYLKMLESAVLQASRSVVLPKALKTAKEDPAYKEVLANADKLLKSKIEGDITVYEYLLIDASGQVLVATDHSSVGQDKSSDPIFFGARKEVYLKDAYFSLVKKMPLIAVSSPLFDGNGAFLGVLAARIKLDDLNDIVTDRTGLGETGEIFIINRSGYMITPSRYVQDAFLKQKIDTENARLALQDSGHPDQKPHLQVFPDYRGVPVLIGHDYIPEMQWRVLGKIEKKEAFVPLDRMRRFFLWVFLLSCGMAWTMVLFIHRIVEAPLRKLQQGIQVISRGDLDYKVATDADDEVGQLSRAFDAMTENLKKTLTSTEKLNQEVEARKKTEEQLKKQALELDASLKESRKSREVLFSMLADNNDIRGKLEHHIEELKRTQNMLVQSEKLASMGRLVSEIAHEVNNPLMIISGNAQLSLMSEPLNDELKNNLRVITEECQRAKGIMQRLLKFSKPSKGETKAVDIHKSLESVVVILEHQLRLKNVEIRRNFGEAIPPVPMDEQAMHEVFMNFINNAADAMPNGGSITIATSLEGESVKIDFRDTGCGLTEEVKKRMLEPFFTTKEKGTGLGLSVCYGIIEAHSGELRFESELNKGTTATLLLPLGGGKT